MLGAFLAYWLFNLFGVNPISSVFIACAIFALAGIPLYYVFVPRLLAAKDPEMLSIIFFFGLSQVIQALAAIAFGTSERSIPSNVLGSGPVELLHQSFPAAWIVSGAASGLAVLLVYGYLYHTRIGYLTRAVMAHREEAVSTGINVHQVSALSFGVGLALAAAAGVLAPFMLGSFTPAMGVDINIASFAVIVVGSLGNPLGAILGGVVYGVSLMFMQTYLSSWANLLPYLLLIGILLVRPSGILGRQVRRA
jgi:branched-chain amino acid transport system permease protein